MLWGYAHSSFHGKGCCQKCLSGTLSEQGLCPCSTLLAPTQGGHDFIPFLYHPLARVEDQACLPGSEWYHGEKHHIRSISLDLKSSLKSILKIPLTLLCSHSFPVQPKVLKQKPVFTASFFFTWLCTFSRSSSMPLTVRSKHIIP